MIRVKRNNATCKFVPMNRLGAGQVAEIIKQDNISNDAVGLVVQRDANGSGFVVLGKENTYRYPGMNDGFSSTCPLTVMILPPGTMLEIV